MKAVIAVDSFKGSLSSIEAGEAIKKGVLDACPDAAVEVCPMADGGEGTVEALMHSRGGTKRKVSVHGPLMENVLAEYVVFPFKGVDHVFIESAASCGLTLIHAQQRNPMRTNTFGVGEQIKDAIEQGYRHFILSLGGSATNDGGTGMLQALGWQFYDKKGHLISNEGNPLMQVDSMSSKQAMKELKECSFTIASDVLNPFYGPGGAAHIFARQKGANDAQILELDIALKRLCEVFSKETGMDVQDILGAGAAGGLGGAMAACLHATMKSGAEIVMDITGLKEKIKAADIVFTGEGSLDQQSLMGKVPVTIAKYAKLHNKKVIGIAGRIDTELVKINEYLDAVFSIQTECRTLEKAMQPDITTKQLEITASQIMRLMR
ncbi:glycerate kinase [Bacillus sp. JJ1122]|uniref:glycerate kinase family protein n=1 Tax=Bacillus sp. JJ1122 TaxID=3122951 RepID=UPI00300064C4